jgi:hypothetical protein
MPTQEGKFVLFTQTEFSAWLSSSPVTRRITLVQNHHTWSPSYRDFSNNHFRLLGGMERSHLERGFAEIAQNLTTFPDGTVALCRSFDKIPAGIKGANSTGICIENLGNFDAGHDTMSEAHKITIVAVNALLCRRFNLLPSVDTIVYHHWYDLITGERTNGSGSTKSCPGDTFFGGNSVESAQSLFVPIVAANLAGLASEEQQTEPTVLRTARVQATLLNVRSGPDAASPIVRRIKKGEMVSVFEDRIAWSRISKDSEWVSSDFLETASEAIV